MAQLSMFDFSLVPMKRAFDQMRVLLQKAEDFIKEKGIPESEIMEARLAPDMAALAFQVQSMSNTSKFIPVRIAGIPNLPMKDDETTIAQLQQRITTTLKFFEGVKREDFEGKEGVEIDLFGMKFNALSYLTGFAIPNFYFHYTTAYNILRMKGVPVGKRDFLGG